MSEFTIYLLRHGELVQTGILCGRTDIALSAQGQQQLVKATGNLPKISHCYSSPLIRCRSFAEKFCSQHGLNLQLNDQLQEMNFGDWDGQDYQTLWQTTDLNDENKTLGSFWENPWQCQPPNGESMNEFTARVDAFWQKLMLEAQQRHNKNNDSSHTLVVTHGGVIRYLLAKILQLPIPGTVHMTNIDVPYAALIHLKIYIDNEGNAWPKLTL